MKKITAFLVALMAIIAAGCGSSNPPAHTPGYTKPPAQVVKQDCPPGKAYMGCALKATPNPEKRKASLPPAGCLFPDVYEGQGNVDWDAVARWQDSHHCKRAAIFKLGEFSQDSKAARNASETARLHFWRAGYWFMHAGVSANTIANVARQFHLNALALDIEVPNAAGTGALVGPLKRLGFNVVIYTAPGTWPGGAGFGSAPLWQATYGSLHVFWRPIVAWQFTDGTFFAPVFIPGIGNDDVSVDMGITKIGVTPPKPDPFAKLVKRPWTFGKDHASEYNTAVAWQKNKCLHPARRTVCKTSDAHLGLLASRIWTVAHAGKTADWRFDRGERFNILRTLHLTNKRF